MALPIASRPRRSMVGAVAPGLTLVAGQAAVLGEQGGHARTVAAIGASGVGLNDLAQSQAIEQFLQIPAHGAPLRPGGGKRR